MLFRSRQSTIYTFHVDNHFLVQAEVSPEELRWVYYQQQAFPWELIPYSVENDASRDAPLFCNETPAPQKTIFCNFSSDFHDLRMKRVTLHGILPKAASHGTLKSNTQAIDRVTISLNGSDTHDIHARHDFCPKIALYRPR